MCQVLRSMGYVLYKGLQGDDFRFGHRDTTCRVIRDE